MDAAIDQQIAETTERLSTNKSQMGEISKQMIDLAVPYLQDLADKVIQAYVIQYSETTKGMPLDRLAELKKETQNLIDVLPQKARAQLSEGRLWPHVLGDDARTVSVSEWKNNFTRDYDLTMHSVRILMEKYEYPKEGTAFYFFENVKETLSERFGIHIKRGGDDLLHSLPCPEDFLHAIKQYEKLIDERNRLIETLNQLKRKRSESEAEDLWNEA